MIVFINKGVSQSNAAGAGVASVVNLNYSDLPAINNGDEIFILAGLNRPGGIVSSISTTDPDYAPLGFGSIFNDNSPAAVGNAVLFHHTADGSESGTVQIQGFSDAANDLHAQMYLYRNNTGQRILFEDAASINFSKNWCMSPYTSSSTGVPVLLPGLSFILPYG